MSEQKQLPIMLDQNLKQATVQYTCPAVEVFSFAVCADWIEEKGPEHWPHQLAVLRMFEEQLAGAAPHNEWVGWGGVGNWSIRHAFYRESLSLCGRVSSADVGHRLFAFEPGFAALPPNLWCGNCLRVIAHRRRRYTLLWPSDIRLPAARRRGRHFEPPNPQSV